MGLFPIRILSTDAHYLHLYLSVYVYINTFQIHIFIYICVYICLMEYVVRNNKISACS